MKSCCDREMEAEGVFVLVLSNLRCTGSLFGILHWGQSRSMYFVL